MVSWFSELNVVKYVKTPTAIYQLLLFFSLPSRYWTYYGDPMLSYYAVYLKLI